MRVIVYEFVCVGADVRNFAFWVGDCGREKVKMERLTKRQTDSAIRCLESCQNQVCVDTD